MTKRDQRAPRFDEPGFMDELVGEYYQEHSLNTLNREEYAPTVKHAEQAILQEAAATAQPTELHVNPTRLWNKFGTALLKASLSSSPKVVTRASHIPCNIVDAFISMSEAVSNNRLVQYAYGTTRKVMRCA